MPRSIDDIIPPSRRAAPSREVSSMPPSRDSFQEKSPRRGFPSWVIALLVIVIFTGTLIGGSLFFRGVSVVIEPRTDAVTITADGEAFRVAGSGTLAFETIVFEASESVKIPATGEEVVSERASGKITIYNDFSTSPQRLIRNTRFESPSGLVYRIQEPVTVPGKTTSGPGSIEVTVYADGVGERYNIGRTTFTLPGLSGSPQFESIYAESFAPMYGGFEGRRATVDSVTEATARAGLQDTLRGKLEAGILSQVKEGYTLVPGGTFLSFHNESALEAPLTGTVEIREGGKAVAPIFETKALAAFIAERTLGEYGGGAAVYRGQPVTLDSLGSLSLSVKGTDDLLTREVLQFTLSGQTTILWEIEVPAIQGAIAGKNTEDVEGILSGNHAVQKVKVTLRPFWESTLPENGADIPVTVSKKR